MKRITEAFDCVPDCPRCGGEGHVCENHPDRSWPDCPCGGAGAPCFDVKQRDIHDWRFSVPFHPTREEAPCRS